MTKINIFNMTKFFNKHSTDEKKAKLRSIDYLIDNKSIASPKEIYLTKKKIIPPAGYYKAGWLLINKNKYFMELRMYNRPIHIEYIVPSIIIAIDKKTLNCEIIINIDPIWKICSKDRLIKELNEMFIRRLK